MKKKYISLEVELVFLENEDIITASSDNDLTASDIFDD